MSSTIDPRLGWIETVRRERIEVEALIQDTPLLRADLSESLHAADRKARKLARVAFERYSEWDAELSRALDATRFPRHEVMDPDRGMFAHFE